MLKHVLLVAAVVAVMVGGCHSGTPNSAGEQPEDSYLPGIVTFYDSQKEIMVLVKDARVRAYGPSGLIAEIITKADGEFAIAGELDTIDAVIATHEDYWAKKVIRFDAWQVPVDVNLLRVRSTCGSSFLLLHVHPSWGITRTQADSIVAPLQGSVESIKISSFSDPIQGTLGFVVGFPEGSSLRDLAEKIIVHDEFYDVQLNCSGVLFKQ